MDYLNIIIHQVKEMEDYHWYFYATGYLTHYLNFNLPIRNDYQITYSSSK